MRYSPLLGHRGAMPNNRRPRCTGPPAFLHDTHGRGTLSLIRGLTVSATFQTLQQHYNSKQQAVALPLVQAFFVRTLRRVSRVLVCTYSCACLVWEGFAQGPYIPLWAMFWTWINLIEYSYSYIKRQCFQPTLWGIGPSRDCRRLFPRWS